MLYVVYGNDREKGRARFRALRQELTTKHAEERVIVEGEMSSGFFDTLTESQGLFGNTTLFVCDCLFDKKNEQEEFFAHQEKLSTSPNCFLVFEPSLDREIIKSFGGKIKEEEFSLPKNNFRPEFNIFSLGDALGRRNKKELWALYREAIKDGVTPEEISGTLFWAVKNIALMKNATPGDDCGMSPFVAKKAREFATNYSMEEIENLSRSLVSIYHESHRGGEVMDVALERFILNL